MELYISLFFHQKKYISLFKENMFTKILMEGLNIMLHKIFIDKIEFQSMTSFLYKKKIKKKKNPMIFVP